MTELSNNKGSWGLFFKSKPSFAFIILSAFALRNFTTPPWIGLTIGFVFACIFERLRPSAPVFNKHLMRDRTKVSINLIVCYMLGDMIANAIGYSIGSMAIGVNPAAGLVFDPAGNRGAINFYSFIVAAWMGYLYYIAKKLDRPVWMWIFGGLALGYLPFLHFFLGELWLLVDMATIGLLLLSCFIFRLPADLPKTPEKVPSQGGLERDLVELNRLKENNLLTEEEYGAQRAAILAHYQK